MKLFTVIYFIILCSCLQRIDNSKQFVSEVNSMYGKKWLSNFSFDQKTSFYRDDTLSQIQNWREFLSVPGKLHIRFGKFEEGNGVIFKSDSQYVFRNGSLVQSFPEINRLQYFAFDFFKMPGKNNIKMMSELGFNKNIFRNDLWQGNECYVIGARENDLNTNQLWYDKETFVLRRIIYKNRGSLIEAHMDNYKKYKSSWIAEEVKIFVNGKIFMFEEYSNIIVDSEIDMSIFNITSFKSARF